jgi:hypothetical protein
MKRLFIIVITLCVSTLAQSSGAGVSPISPAVDGWVRDGLNFPKDGVPDTVSPNSIVQVLDVDRPMNPFEDRGIIEFDISSVTVVTAATLHLTEHGSTGPFPFTVDAFVYSGDGVLALTDFNAGTLFTSFAYSGESSVSLDVTSVVDDLVTSGAGFAGFNLQFAIPTTIPLNGPFVSFHSLELGPAASLEITGGCPWDCADGDGQVGIVDFLALLTDWGNTSDCDFDGGGVDIVDFLKLLANWGPCQ